MRKRKRERVSGLRRMFEESGREESENKEEEDSRGSEGKGDGGGELEK